jgi:hypothetical protein
MENEILQEVWRHRDEFARQYDYNIDAMVAALKEREQCFLNLVVDRRDESPKNRVERTAERPVGASR